MKKVPQLDVRLMAAANFVREGSAVADIGTDHAFLPIYLILTDKCTAAIASDVNDGPLERARLDAAKYEVSDKLVFCKADGLKGLPLKECGITDIVICGMGGELIASILDASSYILNSSVRLVLQPMTKIAELRRWLDENGFSTVDETICTSNSKIYQCIAAEFDGIRRTSTPAELELGKINIARGVDNPLFQQAVCAEIKLLNTIIESAEKGGHSPVNEKLLKNELQNIAERYGIPYDCN